ncbi:hypothetical protein QWA68_015839 [Fusarium oxysporum]|nr:hypothetical protein QWA68_015839 [Fusarium oxysporum]
MFSPRLSGGGTPLIRNIKKELSSSGALLILYPVFALRFSFILASPAFCKIFSQNDKVKLHTVKPIVHPYSRKSLVAAQTEERSALIQQTSCKHGSPRQSDSHSESQGYDIYSASYSRLQRSSISPKDYHK